MTTARTIILCDYEIRVGTTEDYRVVTERYRAALRDGHGTIDVSGPKHATTVAVAKIVTIDKVFN
jgi:hypothetical protein